MKVEQAEHAKALAFAKAGELQRAKAVWRELLSRQPDDPVARYQIGVACHDAGEFAEAARWYGEQLARHPHSFQAWYNLGLVRFEMGELLEAAGALERAAAIDPRQAKLVAPLTRVAAALSEAAELPAALVALDRAIALEPRNATLRLAKGANLSHLGLHRAALDELRQASAIDPRDHRAGSALLVELNYDAELASPQEVAQSHRRWADVYCAAITPSRGGPRSGDAAKKLRIGYLSPRFGHGPLANFFLPVLRDHDRRRFHVTLYSAHAHRDAISERMRAASDQWRQLPDDDDAAAALIASDKLDILVDLAGHAPGHRLLVMARKPAPVQASWLDYSATTGIPAIDYLISDAVHSPIDEARFFTERLVLLPRCRFVCAPVVEPKRTPPPSQRNGFVTFGSFNRHAKITEAMLSIWKAVLDAVPGSRLLLRASAYRGRGTVEWLRERWAGIGAPVERIDFRPYLPLEQAIASYSEVDIALDTSPYNGGVTTCDALSMGVPVVTLAGDRMIARQSAALLGAAGRPEWIASTADEYVATAASLARSPLAQLRADLFTSFSGTPLCGVSEFVPALERAFERMIELGPRDDACAAPIVFTS